MKDKIYNTPYGVYELKNDLLFYRKKDLGHVYKVTSGYMFSGAIMSEYHVTIKDLIDRVAYNISKNPNYYKSHEL